LIEFDNHRFLIDIFEDMAPNQVIMKGAQIGMSTTHILKVLHAAIFKGINQIYTLPTADDVGAFVPGKVNQIINNNLCIRRAIEPKSVAAVEQKQFGKSFIYFKGTFTEREAIMLTSDRNIYDELDKSKMDVIRDYASRLGFSKIREQYYFSTPTIPDFGIDRLWNQSDQKHWRFNCPHCKFRQHMEWEKNVDLERKIYICRKCRREIKPQETKERGEWEAKYPGRETSGYWVSQMIAPWRTAKDLIKEREESEDEEYFYNFVLGMPYLNPEAKIPVGLILKNLTQEKNNERNGVMGVDVGGKDLHVIIGNEKGIFGITRIEDAPGKNKWDRLAELIEVYEVRFCVIDGEWNTNEAYDFAKRFPEKIYLCWYKEDPKRVAIIRFEDEGKFTDRSKDWEEEIKVLVDRTRIIDALLDDLRKGKIKLNFQAGDKRIEELTEHVQTMYARTVTDKLGMSKREWASTTGKDHFLHALVYWKVAMDKKIRWESK